MKIRIILAAVIATLAITLTPAGAAGFTKGDQKDPFADLKPGDYTWKPEVSPAGPVVIIVSIPEQKMYVYRNGVRIGRSTVSTGKPGHSTPTGVFTILEKNVKHESSIYKGAKMPHQQRLTWGGIAMHAGQLPGYPASHGCVRLPVEFAEKLYSVTQKGSTVIIANNKSSPSTTVHPETLLLNKTEVASGPAVPAGLFDWHPEKASTGPVSLIFSSADSQIYAYRNGVEIGRAGVSVDGELPSGTHVYSALDTVNPDGTREWMGTTSIGQGKTPDLKPIRKHVTFSSEFLTLLQGIVSSGSTLIVTDLPVSKQTKSSKDFSILTAKAE